MLTYNELQSLLQLNTVLTIKAINSNASTEYIHQLSIHRQVVKDCIIELLLKRVQEAV